MLTLVEVAQAISVKIALEQADRQIDISGINIRYHFFF